ncbi:ArsB/NhaD family transporter [Pseudolysinimonas kribbensis]|uniref:SLC13 family permease n=1 Tax=Pseudolysinimonas kribbensis TaxID=433641 RepID=UPI0031D868E0
MRIAVLGTSLLAAGAALVATGVLPLAAAADVGDRVWPILLFVVAITVVAELAAEAGLFASLAARLALASGGRTVVLWLLVVVMAVVSTAFLSLDTTAVLLTPVVVLLARHAGLSPLPFALTTVWLANTGSLVLPVSNLTNLLARRVLGPDPLRFVTLLAPAAVVAVLVPCVIIAIVFRAPLRGRFAPSQPADPRDRVLFLVSGVVVIVLLPLLVSGIPPWMPACGAAVVLVAVTALRNRRALRLALVPWQLVLFASGLFLVVEAVHALGSGPVLAAIAGTGDGPLDLLRVAGTGLVGANAVDNLPAYLALEPAAGSPARIAALLVGVNAGPLITPWASLATLLWHGRLRALDVDLPWGRYLLLGLVAAPVTVALATLALALTAG